MKFHFISQLKDTNQLRSSQCSSPLPYLVIHSCELVVNETPLALSWMRPAGPSVFDRVIVYQSLTLVNTPTGN